ncbi:unnamed protein product [Coregonus sp. 'balchen']|nr:unnamed protein product [Coregonus sp. 'balchen']
MVFRKLPGVSASGMGLRLSQKFVFLLFLSGLVTLCFGALFFLPDSVRLKRIFLSKTESQPVTVESENDVREHLKKGAKDPEHLRGITSAKGETSTKLKALSRKPSVTNEAKTDKKVAGGEALEDMMLSMSKTDPASKDEKVTSSSNQGANTDTSFDYNKFKKCLLKPPLGVEHGKPSDPQTLQRREKVKELCAVTSLNLLFLSPAKGQVHRGDFTLGWEMAAYRAGPGPCLWLSSLPSSGRDSSMLHTKD